MNSSSSKFGIYSVLLVLSSLLLPASAVPRNCSIPTGTTPLKHFIERIYFGNYHFITLGVPALLVEDMVSEAISGIAESCSCSHTTVDRSCIKSFLSNGFIVKQIPIEINTDAARPNNKKFFPLYAPRMPSPLTTIQMDLLRTSLKDSLESSTRIQVVLSGNWKGICYPDEGVLLHDRWTDQERACKDFYSAHDDYPTGYSAHLATAYMVGLLQEVRYAGGNLHTAHKILARHVQFVFSALRCTREAWYDLEIPITFVASNARQMKLLLEKVAKYSKDTQKVTHVKKRMEESSNPARIAKYAISSFPEMIDRLSSWASFGKSKSFVENYSGRLTTTTVEEDLAAIPLQSYYEIPGGRFQSCPAGWSEVYRAGVAPGSSSRCCAQPCMSMASHYSSAFSLAIDQEECCALCNLASCPGDGMDQVINLFVDNLEERLAFVISL